MHKSALRGWTNANKVPTFPSTLGRSRGRRPSQMSRRVHFPLHQGDTLRSTTCRAAMISRYSTIREYFTQATTYTPIVSPRKHDYNVFITSINHNLQFVDGRQASYIERRHFHNPPALFTDSKPIQNNLNSQSSLQRKEGKAQNCAEEPPRLPDSPPTRVDLQNYSRFFRQLAQSVPHIHRPTRDDFLNLTSSFWHRLRIRFKWLTIRSFRKFNADDLSAFFSFVLVGQTLWILVGTSVYKKFLLFRWMTTFYPVQHLSLS